MATSPTPPVAFEDQCAIIHNNTLFVYSPDAFQTLDLTEGAEWKQLQNGVSVQHGVCVKGGIEGDSDNPALYVVGGVASDPNYTGLQRYSIQNDSWTTITPQVKVTANRQGHGATYLNASSAIIVYGGSQNGYAAPSTETFLMLMYAPYNIQSYSSIAPPVVDPQIHPWDADRAVMVGGSATNQEVFLFDPDNSWQNLGVTLPQPIGDQNTTKTSMVLLDDNSKVLLTYHMGQSPNSVTRNVLMGAFNQPAQQGQTVGNSNSSGVQSNTTSAKLMKRSVFLGTYPPYNSTDALTTTRSGFAVAQGSNELAAIVGGDSQDTIAFFDKLENSWVSAESLVGAQQPLVSTTPSSTASPTSSVTPPATSTAPPATVGTGPNTLAILGGVLGGICGLAAILIILLLWLRQKRKRRAQAAEAQDQGLNPEEGKNSLEQLGIRPLANQGQPMGRSPVASTIAVDERDSIALFNPKFNEKAYEAGAGNKAVQQPGSGLLAKNPFTRQQSPLTISKPMLADLGDYKERPSIELGKATPMAPVIVNPSNLSTVTSALPEIESKKDQRKTDEGWAAYFQSFQSDDDKKKRDTVATNASSATSTSAAPSRSGRGAFWPGSGVTEKTRASKPPPLRNEPQAITTSQVVAASPTFQSGPSNPRTLTMSTAEGIPAKISRAESISTEATDDDDYEDDRLSTYSSGVPQVAQHTSWTPFGNGSSSHVQTVIHRDSSGPSLELRPSTTVSNETINSGTTKSSIPTFPMPAATVRRVQPSGELEPPRAINPSDYRTSEDYFGRSPGTRISQNPVQAPVLAKNRTSYQRPQPPSKPEQETSDMSWINLGTPGQ